MTDPLGAEGFEALHDRRLSLDEGRGLYHYCVRNGRDLGNRRAVVALALLVTGLSGTGVWLWWRKRLARRSSRQASVHRWQDRTRLRPKLRPAPATATT